MKKIKSLICILLTIGTVLFVCDKSNVVLANNHTLHTVTSFSFIDHYARVNIDFTGYENTANLCVDVKIEKQTVLFFNETVVSESYVSQGESYQNEFFYPLFEDGIYHCTVTYTVTNGNGEDKITFSDTGTYRLSDHTEHTHVWNREVTEPTCTESGTERKFCYCGKVENTLLTKLPHTPEPETEPTNYNSLLGYTTTRCQHCATILCREKAIFNTTSSNQSGTSSGLGVSGNSSSASLNQPFNGAVSSQSQSCSCASCRLKAMNPQLPNPNPHSPIGSGQGQIASSTKPWYYYYIN